MFGAIMLSLQFQLACPGTPYLCSRGCLQLFRGGGRERAERVGQVEKSPERTIMATEMDVDKLVLASRGKYEADLSTGTLIKHCGLKSC